MCRREATFVYFEQSSRPAVVVALTMLAGLHIACPFAAQVNILFYHVLVWPLACCTTSWRSTTLIEKVPKWHCVKYHAKASRIHGQKYTQNKGSPSHNHRNRRGRQIIKHVVPIGILFVRYITYITQILCRKCYILRAWVLCKRIRFSLFLKQS